jgi:dipeptidyl aminopeptidase/acylaminoacyl peptidase
MQPYLAKKYAPENWSPILRCMIVDTDTGMSRVLLDAPFSWKHDADILWSPDSQAVVLADTYLPLEGATDWERKERSSTAYSIEVQIPALSFNKITHGEIRPLRWNDRGNELLFQRDSATEEPDLEIQTVFSKHAGEGWKAARNDMATNGPEIVLHQDLNSPPRLYAIETKTKIKSLLYDLNPRFERLKFGRVAEITWPLPGGRSTTGGLYYPADYVPGKRYPLVIQTHGWNPHYFLVDGPWTTAFAAQPLSGKGIMVLQAPMTYLPEDNVTAREGSDEVANFEGALKYLDGRGLIDPTRVGIIGFSRTCFHVKYMLTHSDFHFEAVSVTDGLDGGYFQYMIEGNLVLDGNFNGGPPFGDGLSLWMERSPGFNVDKVRAPILITALNPGSLLFEWEWFALLSMSKKPVEMIYIQDGTHILQRPWDRMISQGGTVDWFSFWLKSEEDPDPAKAEQYARWRELRKLQEENEKRAKAASSN